MHAEPMALSVECSCRFRNAWYSWRSPAPGMFDLILDVMVVSKPRSVQSSRWDGLFSS
jgi:hypothetical protein